MLLEQLSRLILSINARQTHHGVVRPLYVAHLSERDPAVVFSHGATGVVRLLLVVPVHTRIIKCRAANLRLFHLLVKDPHHFLCSESFVVAVLDMRDTFYVVLNIGFVG